MGKSFFKDPVFILILSFIFLMIVYANLLMMGRSLHFQGPLFYLMISYSVLSVILVILQYVEDFRLSRGQEDKPLTIRMKLKDLYEKSDSIMIIFLIITLGFFMHYQGTLFYTITGILLGCFTVKFIRYIKAFRRSLAAGEYLS